MGWTFSHNAYAKSDIRDQILRDCTYSNEGRSCKVLIHRTVGNHLWFALEIVAVTPEPKTTRFVMLALLAKDNGHWGYKDMDESAGPYYYDCPKAVIKAAGPTDNKWALEWREKVEAFHAAKAAKVEMAKRIKVGSIVVLSNAVPSTFRVACLAPFRGYAVDTNIGPYRLVKSRITDVREPAEN